MTPASRRLASRSGIRQVEVSLRADAAAAAVDLAVARLWRQVLLTLKEAETHRNPARAYREILFLLRRLSQTAIDSIARSLDHITRWGFQTTASQVTRSVPGDALQFAAIAARMTESKAQDAGESLFPGPTEDQVRAIIYGGDWRERIAAGTRLGEPEQLASLAMQSVAQGKAHQETAKALLPHVQGNRASARRLARTMGLHVANESQMQTFAELGDLVIGYQIHATLDQHSRPHHAARNGTIYYVHPKPGQLGLDQMPRPPLEADGTVAWNCRCYLSPVLTEPEALAQPGADLSAFASADGPDPVVYGEWFDQADEKRRRMAVGTRRYSQVSSAGTHPPAWEDFIGPDGKLVPLDQLKAESPEQRAQRVQAVRAAQARQRADKVEVSTFGFRRTKKPAPVASVPAPVAAAKASPLLLTRADLDRMSRKELIAAAKAVGIDGAGGHKSEVLRQRIEAEIVADARRKQAVTRPTPTPELPRPVPLTPQEAMRTVATAFQRLQTATNQVSIADLKDATGLDVPTLHQAINDLRRSGVLTGSQAERQIDARARASMIREEGSLIVYLSLRHGMLAALRSIAGLV